MSRQKDKIQQIWGVALVVMGVNLFLFGPLRLEQMQVMPGNPGFLKFCIYFVAVALVFGGAKKILQFKKKDDI